jgi:peroxiredoxin
MNHFGCMWRIFGWAIGLLFCANVPSAFAQTQSLASVDIDLSLPTADGNTLRLVNHADAELKVYCFLGCECPLAKLYAPRLNQLASAFADRDVQFIGINSNPQDSMDDVAAYHKGHSLSFPIVKDHDGLARATFEATRTPEVIALDARGKVIYRGRIDDQYRPGVIQSQPQRDDLRIAIEEFLAGKKVTIEQTQPAGCLIAKARKIDPKCEVTYCGEVAAILRRHCVECHRAGEIGPFALTDYEEVTGWADMIMETIDERRMPPWHASPDHEPILNHREITTAERETLRRWMEGGMPYGDDSQLAPLPEFISGWQLPRTPDQVLNVTAKPFKVVAEGVVEYQYFVVDPEFTEDMWVEAAEILPGNRSVVHHAIAFIRPPDGVALDGLGMLTAYVPGQRVAPVKPGTAKKVPAGSKLVFQMHYTPTGQEESDASKIGLLFTSRKQVTHESISMLNINHELEIPPNEGNAKVSAMSQRFPRDGVLLSIAPHMHLRGKAISINVHQAGKDRTILEVPRYDFNWQHTYLLKNPIALKDVESIGFTATFDNSSANPFNPDPSQFVTWGDQTWEEMAVVFYEVARPLSGDIASSSSKDEIEKAPAPEAQLSAELQSEVNQLLKDLDRDQNGIVEYEESSLAVKWRLFKQLDRDGDRIVSVEEATSHIQSRH